MSSEIKFKINMSQNLFLFHLLSLISIGYKENLGLRLIERVTIIAYIKVNCGKKRKNNILRQK